MNILVVDDENSIVDVIQAYLNREGYTVFSCYNGKEAMEIFDKKSIDFVILDLMLPDLAGEEICKKIRVKSQVPILMLTAKADEINRINGLDIGADDYMLKPFSPKELVARVRAILRRVKPIVTNSSKLSFAEEDIIIDFNKMEVKKRGQLIELTATEYKLLSMFTQNIGRTFTREDLVVKIFGYDYEGYDRTIDTHIKNLRHKIEDKDNKYIFTVYGLGYKFMGE